MRMAFSSRSSTGDLAYALALVAAMVVPVRAEDDPNGVAFFETKIRPVLVEKCQECHSSQAKKPKGGLKVDSRAAIRAGGTSGPAVVPGDLDASLLYQAISAADGVEPMPPKGKLPAVGRRRFPPVDHAWVRPTRATEHAGRVGNPRRVRPRAAIGGRSSPSRRPSVPAARPGHARLGPQPDRRLRPGQARGKEARTRPRGRPPHA